MMGVVVIGIVAAALLYSNRERFVPATGTVADHGTFQVSVTGSLTRVEARRLLRGPAVWAGFAIAGFMLVMAFDGAGEAGVRPGLSGLLALPLTLLAGCAASLAAVRDRGQTQELFGSLPVAGRSRVPAHLLAGVPIAVMAGVGIVALALLTLGLDLTGPIETGGRFAVIEVVWRASLLDLIQGPLMILMGMALATAGTVWLRHPLGGMLAVIVLFFTPVMWYLPPFVESGTVVDWATDQPYVVTRAALAMHVVYQVAFTLAAGGAALLKHDRRPRIWVASILMVGAAVAAALVRSDLLP